MSDTVILALIASIAPTIAALAALFVSIKNSRKSDTIIEKATEIHSLTNSQLSAVTSALAVANAKIEGMQKLVASMVDAKKDAAVVAAQKK